MFLRCTNGTQVAAQRKIRFPLVFEDIFRKMLYNKHIR